MTEAANALKEPSKKCMPRPLQGNKHRSTRPSPRCAKAFASSQECSIQCGERDLKADRLENRALPHGDSYCGSIVETRRYHKLASSLRASAKVKGPDPRESRPRICHNLFQ